MEIEISIHSKDAGFLGIGTSYRMHVFDEEEGLDKTYIAGSLMEKGTADDLPKHINKYIHEFIQRAYHNNKKMKAAMSKVETEEDLPE